MSVVTKQPRLDLNALQALYRSFVLPPPASPNNSWMAFSFCRVVILLGHNLLASCTHLCQASGAICCVVRAVLVVTPSSLQWNRCVIIILQRGVEYSGLPFLTFLLSGAAMRAKFGKRRRYALHDQRNDFNSIPLRSDFKSIMTSDMWSGGSNLRVCITCPRSSVLSMTKLHFLRFSVTPALCRSKSTLRPCDTCLLAFRKNMIISWRCTRAKYSFYPQWY